MANPVSRFPNGLYILVAATGLATLSWEVIWQIKSSLALGVSAWGAAITLAATMGGMCVGSFLCGYFLKEKNLRHPLRLYGVFEIIIGISGLFLHQAFRLIEKLDSEIYHSVPAEGPWVHLLGIVLVLGVPTMCMGATLPVFGLAARQYRTSITVLYGLNTLGAAAGALIAAFILIPQFGVTHTGNVISLVNIIVGMIAFFFAAGAPVAANVAAKKKTAYRMNPRMEEVTALVTGFATFALEIAWFRSLTAAFLSTTDAFAIMLSAILIALGLAARLVPMLKKLNLSLGVLLALAGILVLLASPLVERFDHVAAQNAPAAFVVFQWFFATLVVLGPPVLFLGIAFPWIMDEQRTPRRWGMLYALNTFAAIVGSLSAAWVLLPMIGVTRTAWLAGAMVVVTGLAMASRESRIRWGIAAVVALAFAFVTESGVGVTRAQGPFAYEDGKSAKLLKSYEGPDTTAALVEYKNGQRRLLIDGASASGQSGKEDFSNENYMPWMGRLPMLLFPSTPQNALVICFGTGQTANAVRKEDPQSLDIVDINANVFKLAPFFTSNEKVLDDPSVKAIVMDGRAYIRRTDKAYDIITLEPMPPTFAGVNALYSREFYALAREHMSAHGVIAQWLPFSGVAPRYSASIAKTFQDVFPNAILWIDPVSKTGILLGSKDDAAVIGKDWPGFARVQTNRNMTEVEVKDAILLDQQGMRRYGGYGEIITDDNQLLAYGDALVTMRRYHHLTEDNFELLETVKKLLGGER